MFLFREIAKGFAILTADEDGLLKWEREDGESFAFEFRGLNFCNIYEAVSFSEVNAKKSRMLTPQERLLAVIQLQEIAGIVKASEEIKPILLGCPV